MEGTRVLAGRAAVYAAKARCAGLDGEHGGSSLSGLRNPPLFLFLDPPVHLQEKDDAGQGADCAGSRNDYNDHRD